MMKDSTTITKSDPSLRPLLRSLLLELAIYAPLVIIYFLLILRYANQFITRLYQTQTVVYAIVATGAIVVQGVMLEWLTSWLLRRFGLR